MLNEVRLIGHLGADPVVSYTPGGAKVLSVSLATTHRYKDKQGEKKESTEWHRLVIWNRTAEIVAEFCHKGSKLYVEGSLRTRSYDDKQGVKRYVTEVLVERVLLLGGADHASSGHASGAAVSAAPVTDNFAAFDDDIPF